MSLCSVSSPPDIGQPYSLDVFEGHVYWTTKDKGEVWRTNKFGKGNKVKVVTINPWLTQVRIYQQHRHNQSGQNSKRSQRVRKILADWQVVLIVVLAFMLPQHPPCWLLLSAQPL